MKKCSKCGKYKPASEYYKNKKKKDGLYSHCKGCHYIYTQKQIRDERCKEYQKEYHRRYVLTEEQKQRNLETQRRWRYSHPEYYAQRRRSNLLYRMKALARTTLNNEIIKGNIQREVCVRCSHPVTDGHHPDYNKPLEVVWLCRRHHLDLHKQLKTNKETNV